VETHELQNAPPRILAVDDEPNALFTIKNVLENYGYEVEVAADPAHALSLVKESRFDAVVIDQLLPEQTGLELLREIRKIRRGQVAIIISGVEPTEELKLEIAQMGAIFIRKWDLPPEFWRKLEMLLDQSKNPTRVFISYANPNLETVNWIYWRLKENGFAPWMAKQDLLGGYAWDKQIEQAIDECDFFLSCLSDIAVKRTGYFQTETRLALAKHDRVGDPFILPLRLDQCELPVEFVKRNIQYISYDDNGDWWERLLKTLRAKRT
jgi:CheY-like chemotaxis protein